MKQSILLLLCLACSACPAAADDPSPDVPLSHALYRTLDRFEARGWFKEPVPNSRPLSRNRAARLLLQVLQSADAGAPLSRTERGVLERHRAEFAAELAALGYAQTAPESGEGILRGGNLVAWRTAETAGAIDPLFRQRLLLLRGAVRPRENVSQTYVGGIVRGTYRNRFGFRIRHFEAREWSSRARASRSDVLAHPVEEVQIKGRSVDFREAAFQFVLATPWLDIDLGKGGFDWGPGRTGNLLLGNNAPSYGMVRLRAGYGRVSWTHIVGFLRARPGLIDTTRIRVDNGHFRTFPPRKQLAAHRLEVALSRGITLGLHESVVYGDRSTEFLYAIPVTLLIAAQSYLGNTDNVLVGLDLEASPVANLQVYLALLFDDLAKLNPGSFSNKYALQAGLLWVDAFRLPDTDLRLEYVRLEPFVYSHNFSINTYEHFDLLLGYPSGPNADRLFARIDHRFSPSFSLALLLDRERQGENFRGPDGTLVNVGGSAEQGRRPDDPAVRNFLSGALETRTRLGLDLAYEPVRDLLFTFQYLRTAAGNILLPDGVRGNATAHRWTFGLDLNFF